MHLVFDLGILVAVPDDTPQPSSSPPLRSWFFWRPLARWLFRATLLVVGVMMVGNASILASHAVVSATAGQSPPTDIGGLPKLRVVDEKVWRGNAPDDESYAALAAAGVTTIVDLRAERDLDVSTALLGELGLERHHLPIRDGQTPTTDEVAAFLRIVKDADGLVFLHCGAGVGRTGAMTAAYLVASGQLGGGEALHRNMAVGPPSIEQIWYAAGLDGQDHNQGPPAPVKWVSRFFDAPRRVWSVANL